MLIGPFSPNILSGHFGPEIGSRTFIPLLEALFKSAVSRDKQQHSTDKSYKTKIEFGPTNF